MKRSVINKLPIEAMTVVQNVSSEAQMPEVIKTKQRSAMMLNEPGDDETTYNTITETKNEISCSNQQ